MASGNTVSLVFAGDSQSLERSFAKVGSASAEMADSVGKSSRRMVDDSGRASADIAGAIDGSERKFRGLGDIVGGTGDVMEGFRTGSVAQVAMGMADLAGGVTDFVIPAITGMANLAKGAAKSAIEKLTASTVTLNATLDSTAVKAAAALGAIGLVIVGGQTVKKDFEEGGFWVGLLGPGPVSRWLQRNTVDRFHTGGVFPGVGGQEGLAVLQAGETVVPRGQSGSGGVTINVNAGSVIHERDLPRVIMDAIRAGGLYGVS